MVSKGFLCNLQIPSPAPACSLVVNRADPGGGECWSVCEEGSLVIEVWKQIHLPFGRHQGITGPWSAVLKQLSSGLENHCRFSGDVIVRIPLTYLCHWSLPAPPLLLSCHLQSGCPWEMGERKCQGQCKGLLPPPRGRCPSLILGAGA